MFTNFKVAPSNYPTDTVDYPQYLKELLHDDFVLFQEKYKELWNEESPYLVLAGKRLHTLPIDLSCKTRLDRPNNGVALVIQYVDDKPYATFEFSYNSFPNKVIYWKYESKTDSDPMIIEPGVEQYIKLFKASHALDFPTNNRRLEIRLHGITDDIIKKFNGSIQGKSEMRKEIWLGELPASRFDQEFKLRSFRVTHGDIFNASPKTVELIINLMTQLTASLDGPERIERFLAQIKLHHDSAEHRAIWNRVFINYISYIKRNILLFYEAGAQAYGDEPVAGIIYELDCKNAVVLKSIWINPECRNKGYGTEILNGLTEEFLTCSGYDNGIRVFVPADKEAYFIKMGFYPTLRGILF